MDYHPQEPESVDPASVLSFFEFEVATINADLSITRNKRHNQYFIEDLGNGVELEMVLIPGGTFMMGSPEHEEGQFDREGPLHQVTVPSFFMGRYPITQAQWRAIAALPKVNRDLKPNPAYFFTGDDRPIVCVEWWWNRVGGVNRPDVIECFNDVSGNRIEGVNWLDAVECGDRLSRKTRREYRLPTEAEWEYACRAGTTTPFHFGETITAELANYRTIYADGQGTQAKGRGETTPVNHFGVANAFGLCDMHGNVWEWCLDHWHDNYEGAPTDGSAWFDNERAERVIRGGSWLHSSSKCRSAARYSIDPNNGKPYIGFRLACGFLTILQ